MNALAIQLYLTIRYINLSFNYFGNFYRIIVTHKAMKKENTTLSSFISTLDAEILKEDEAILLTGGFASATTTVDAKSNYGCNTDNCPCPITNNCKSDDLISHT